MLMNGVPLTRSVFVAPFSNILNEIGAPTSSMLSKFHLPSNLEQNRDRYVPLFPALRFVTSAERSQGLKDFGFLAGQRLGFDVLNDGFKATVYRSPTLLSALRAWSSFVQMEDNVLQLNLVRDEQNLRVCYKNIFPRAKEMLHLEHAQWIQNMMTVNIVRQFAGEDWFPKTFAFQSRYEPSVDTRSLWPNTRFLSGQTATWIDVPISRLSLQIDHSTRPAASRNQCSPIGNDIASTLKHTLAGYLEEHVPSIVEVAEILGTSVRSLQRELSAAGVFYSQLLDQVRFEEAAKLLGNTDAKIIDVAYSVGYSNPSHFSRSFLRLAGVTPQEFRQNLGEKHRHIRTKA